MSNLTDVEITEKYRKIISDTIDENRELTEEGNRLKQDIEKLRCEMLALNEARKNEQESLRKSFEYEIERGKKFEDWARRLVLELQAWEIEPVPFDLDEAKEQKIQERKAENDSDFMNKKKE